MADGPRLTRRALGAALFAGGLGAQGQPAEVVLPAPRAAGALEDALRRRRSVRRYTAQPLALAELAALLWAAQGTSASDGRRTAPSAGARYPLELRLVAVRVDGLAAGVWQYLPATHALRLAAPAPLEGALQRAAGDQAALGEAAAVLVIAAVEARTAERYGARAARYVAFEAGAAAQNLALQAAALQLGSVVVGAFDDAAVALLAGLGAPARPVVLMPLGRPA